MLCDCSLYTLKIVHYIYAKTKHDFIYSKPAFIYTKV